MLHFLLAVLIPSWVLCVGLQFHQRHSSRSRHFFVWIPRCDWFSRVLHLPLNLFLFSCSKCPKCPYLRSYMQAVPGLNTALSCLFDIRGERVLVQGLIPGLLCADQQSSLQYGRIESLGLDNWDKVPEPSNCGAMTVVID